jgi:hypothetical protein
MAVGELTLNGSPLLVGAAPGATLTAVNIGFSSGNLSRIEYDQVASAEYGITGSALIRGALNTGEIIKFNDWFSHADARNVQEMAYLAMEREKARTPPYHVLLVDERCKVIDSNPPKFAYLGGSLSVRSSGLTTMAYRVYKAIFRNGMPLVGETSDFGKELVFEMQVGDPFFASEQLPPPPLTLISVGSIPENADTSSNTYLLAEFS